MGFFHLVKELGAVRKCGEAGNFFGVAALAPEGESVDAAQGIQDGNAPLGEALCGAEGVGQGNFEHEIRPAKEGTLCPKIF